MLMNMKDLLAVASEPNCIEPACLAAMKEVVNHKIDLFHATGKAALY